MTPNKTPARLDADRTAEPLTSIVHHPPHGGCIGPYMPLVNPEHVDADGKRTPLTTPAPVLSPRAMAETACARRVLGQGYQEGYEEGVKAERARAAATLTPSEVTLAKVLAAYQKGDWLAVGDALYAACLIGNGKDEFGMSPIGKALLERARKEGVL